VSFVSLMHAAHAAERPPEFVVMAGDIVDGRSGETGPHPIDHSLLALPNLTFFPGSGFLGQILREAHRAREKSDES
jgi:hypothetical protein